MRLRRLEGAVFSVERLAEPGTKLAKLAKLEQGLHSVGKIAKTGAYSRMIKKVSVIIGLIALSSFLTGCASTRNSVQGYSIRSYQGALPMADYKHVNPEAYGVPMSPR